jgi:hypothetical protein
MLGLDLDERNAQAVRNKNMKAELTCTNFTLGDEKVDYESTSKAGARISAEGPSIVLSLLLNSFSSWIIWQK